MEFRRERLILFGEVKKGWRGIIIGDFGFERLRFLCLGREGEKVI